MISTSNASHELLEEIRELKTERDAVIFAHNYQRPEIQELADRAGDSFELAQAGREVEQSVVVFCGVLFMAESAAILSPDKTVLLPEKEAGCALADMATEEQVLAVRKENPDAAIISYVNSTAAVKALSDCCCTSSNALKVIDHYKDREIVYLPDQNLAKYARQLLKLDNIRVWPGYCYVHHDRITAEIAQQMIRAHPDAVAAAHPECRPAVLRLADHIASTSGMVRYCAESDADEFIILTEVGLRYKLEQAAPSKTFYMVEAAVCESMKLTRLVSVRDSLLKMQHQIAVPQEIAEAARRALEKMLTIS